MHTRKIRVQTKAVLWMLGMALGIAAVTKPPKRVWANSATSASAQDPDPDYDRLDGKGKSGKKVDVIEWEGNLEIHVYPKGSLAGLALKLDKRNKNKPVMVIGYRFSNAPKQQLIRRAILGYPINEGFHAYQDTSIEDYDKVIVSMNQLADGVVAYRLDPEPKQLYPDGHPALAEQASPKTPTRGTASTTDAKSDEMEEVPVNEEGTIQPFFMERKVRAPYTRGDMK